VKQRELEQSNQKGLTQKGDEHKKEAVSMSVAAGATQRSRAERNDHLTRFVFLSAFLPIKILLLL